MDTNQISFNIELPKNFKRKTSLVNSHEEMIIDIRQTGGNWWVEYTVKLTPNENSIWNVLLIDVAEKKYEYLNETFHLGIKSGLAAFIKQQEIRGIGLGGIDFQIKNFSYHPVDSRPAAFKFTLLELLNRLEQTNSFQKEIIETEYSSSFFETREVAFDRLKEHYLLEKTHLQIGVPRIFKETIKLTKRIEIILNDLRERRQTFKVILSPKSYDDRTRYLIDLELRDENDRNDIGKFCNQIILLNNQIIEILQVLKTKKYNISGLYILAIPLFDESKEPFIESNKEYLKWAILNAIFSPENIEIKNETRL